MCYDEFDIRFVHSKGTSYRKKDLCNRELDLNRGLICAALNALRVSSPKVLKCLDGNSPCGLMGMLWKKYLSDNINVQINGVFPHSVNVINANLNNNGLKVNVINEDPCILLRKNKYDFIYLNCKTSASQYLDSLFSKVNDEGVVVLTTSEDPSLYWQSPEIALRSYGGSIVRTSYLRELGIRLVIAEMVRAAARYNKGVNILCTASFKVQQSFTIIVRVMKGTFSTTECLKKIRRLLHCSVCEDRAFVPNSAFAHDSVLSLLSCACSRNSESKIVNELGPLWSGEIFNCKFVESMLKSVKGFPWEHRVKYLLGQILDEAHCPCGSEEVKHPEAKKFKTEDMNATSVDFNATQPSFYFKTHKHHPSNQQIQKVASIIQTLHGSGFRASRTHFEPGAVRTNATLREFIGILEKRF